MNCDFTSVLEFWFSEIEPRQWWLKDGAFDRLIADRFLGTHQAACRAELYAWRGSVEGSLAEIIVLDQFSRNIYRDLPAAFAQDSLALSLAQHAIARGFDQKLPETQRSFLYLPFMHSESSKIHEVALDLYRDLGSDNNLNFELRHKAIIDRFGRYPHRNAILGRDSTDEELLFLSEPGSAF